MRLTVYHLKTCDSCRKAIKAMGASGHDLSLVDVRAEGVSRDVLQKMLTAVGVDVLLNTRSTTWRGLSEAQKADIDAAKALDLLIEHPTLMKRPVIDDGTEFHVGWSKAVQAQFSP